MSKADTKKNVIEKISNKKSTISTSKIQEVKDQNSNINKPDADSNNITQQIATPKLPYKIVKTYTNSFHNTLYKVEELNTYEYQSRDNLINIITDREFTKKNNFYIPVQERRSIEEKLVIINKINSDLLIEHITGKPPMSEDDLLSKQQDKDKNKGKDNKKVVKPVSKKDVKGKKDTSMSKIDNEEKDKESEVVVNPNKIIIDNYIDMINKLNSENNFYLLPIKEILVKDSINEEVANSTIKRIYNKDIYFTHFPSEYCLKDLIKKNPKGLDLRLIKTIIYQLIKAIKFFKRKQVTNFNIKTETVVVDIKRNNNKMIGFKDKSEFLDSNINSALNELHVFTKIADLSKIKSNIPRIISEEEKEEKDKEVKKKEVKKKPNNDKAKKDQNKKGNKNDKNQQQKQEEEHFLVTELKQNPNYELNRYSAPELLINNLLKNYNSNEDDEDNLQPYGNEIDIWSVGCIMAELIDGNCLFPNANNDFDLLYYVNKISPLSDEVLKSFVEIGVELDKENFNCLYVNNINNSKNDLSLNIRQRYLGKTNKCAINLLERLLDSNPKTRISVDDALKHEFLFPFFETIQINNEYCKSSNLPKESCHLIDSDFKKLTKENQDSLLLKNMILYKEDCLFANGVVDQNIGNLGGVGIKNSVMGMKGSYVSVTKNKRNNNHSNLRNSQIKSKSKGRHVKGLSGSIDNNSSLNVSSMKSSVC